MNKDSENKQEIPNWPHAPVHSLDERGTYFLTAGIYHKKHLLSSPEHKNMLLSLLFSCAEEFGWCLQAWAILSNHYHFMALSPDDPKSLKPFMSKLHTVSARELNKLDNQPGRKVWHQYWDIHITFQRSYLARLKYVHNNPVHHGVVDYASNYPWCSAGWFECNAEPAFRKTVERFKVDKVTVHDDF